jgi:stearoyl-CoA desaturase (delta-9 desaturase)
MTKPAPAVASPAVREKDWVNIFFLSMTPIVGIFGTLAYVLARGVVWWEPALLLVSFAVVGIAITAGYHRCFSHKAYTAHPAVQAVYLFFGSWALQNSALHWSSDHRDHHRFVDREQDPYNIQRGFLWAHILWIFYKQPKDRTFDNAKDLLANRLVMLQHKVAGPLGVITGLGIPTLIGAAFWRPLGGLLWGGFLRIVIIHHTTFFVNSLAHIWGTRPFTEENSARDNWALALVTHGEGYHNFHHKFPSDFRNGIRWYQWDPGKWFIGALRGVGLARDLRVTPEALILRSRLQTAIGKSEARLEGAPATVRERATAQLEAARASLDGAMVRWNEMQSRRRELTVRRRELSAQRRADARHRRREELETLRGRMREARQAWRDQMAEAQFAFRVALRELKSVKAPGLLS